MANLVNILSNMAIPGGEFRLRENKQAPYAAYDVIVRRAGEKRGRCVYTLVYSLCKMEPMVGLLQALRGTTLH